MGDPGSFQSVFVRIRTRLKAQALVHGLGQLPLKTASRAYTTELLDQLECKPRAVIIPSWEFFNCCYPGLQAIVELYIEKGGTVVILIGNYPSVNTLLNMVKFLRSMPALGDKRTIVRDGLG
jgi:hypothetical protein